MDTDIVFTNNLDIVMHVNIVSVTASERGGLQQAPAAKPQRCREFVTQQLSLQDRRLRWLVFV